MKEKPPATVPSTVIPKPPPFLTELTSQDKRNNNVITQTNSNHATTSSSLYATTAKQTDTGRNSQIPKDGAVIKQNDNRENMNDELAKVLKLYREKSNWEIHKTPEIYIQPGSTPADVKLWLKAKGFSDTVIGKFGRLNGYELLSLSRDTLEEHCGVEEGRRLLSQITVQRNVSGYKTTRTSELQKCLAKARKRIDEN